MFQFEGDSTFAKVLEQKDFPYNVSGGGRRPLFRGPVSKMPGAVGRTGHLLPFRSRMPKAPRASIREERSSGWPQTTGQCNNGQQSVQQGQAPRLRLVSDVVTSSVWRGFMRWVFRACGGGS